MSEDHVPPTESNPDSEEEAKKRVLADLLSAAVGEPISDIDMAEPQLQRGGYVTFCYKNGAGETKTHAFEMSVVIDALGGGESVGEADEAAGAQATASLLCQHGSSVMLLDGEEYRERGRSIHAELKELVKDPDFFKSDAGVESFDNFLTPMGLRALFGPPMAVGLGATPAVLQVVELRPDVPTGGVSMTFLGLGPTADDAFAQLTKGINLASF